MRMGDQCGVFKEINFSTSWGASCAVLLMMRGKGRVDRMAEDFIFTHSCTVRAMWLAHWLVVRALLIHPLRTGSANNRTWGKNMRSFKRIKESNKSPKLKNKMCVGCLWMSSKTCYERSYQQKRVFPKIPPGTCSGSDYTGRGFQKHPWSGSPLGSTENVHLVYFWRKPRQLSTTTVVE